MESEINDDQQYSEKRRRASDDYLPKCLSIIKENIKELTENVSNLSKQFEQVNERQQFVLKSIEKFEKEIGDIKHTIDTRMNYCPYEQDIKGMITQCAVCKGGKETWKILPVIIQSLIAIITVSCLIYTFRATANNKEILNRVESRGYEK